MVFSFSESERCDLCCASSLSLLWSGLPWLNRCLILRQAHTTVVEAGVEKVVVEGGEVEAEALVEEAGVVKEAEEVGVAAVEKEADGAVADQLRRQDS